MNQRLKQSWSNSNCLYLARNLSLFAIKTLGNSKPNWSWQNLTVSIIFVLQESRAVARKPRDAAAVLFGLKFADDIHYKFKSSQATKARLQSSKHTGTKQNLMQNGDSRSFKVTCFGVSGKAIRH